MVTTRFILSLTRSRRIFDDFVVGDHFVVGNGPVVTPAVVGCAFEIKIAHAVGLTTPAQRASAEDAFADPVERLRLRVGIFEIVDEPLLIRFAAGVAQALNGALAKDGRGLAEVGHLPGLHVLSEIFGGDFGSGFEQSDAPAGFGEPLGGPSAGGAGANDDGVEWLLRDGNLRHKRQVYSGCALSAEQYGRYL
jgi:hypothetical protein